MLTYNLDGTLLETNAKFPVVETAISNVKGTVEHYEPINVQEELLKQGYIAHINEPPWAIPTSF